MSAERRFRERILVLFIVGVLALNYPVLAIVNRMLLPLGIFLYLFLVWSAIIVLMALIVERPEVADCFEPERRAED